MSGIKFFLIFKIDADNLRPSQEARFETGWTVAGTRENRHFKPMNESKISVTILEYKRFLRGRLYQYKWTEYKKKTLPL
uniref:Uncharacterized protein n=1 Tax=Romanomermis culicivorax TaxID=13658 RepID=A0A915JW38_ROMCU